MFRRSSTPPTGPRSSSPARRGMGRGGIQKRRTGQAKVDKDGDLVMNPVGSPDVSGMGRGYSEGSRSSRGRATARGGQSAGTSRGNFSIQQAQQAIIRGLESQQANILESRVSHGASSAHIVGSSKGARRQVDRSLPQLRIRGLRDSKAASNPDGGVKDLLNFVERKANSIDAENRQGVRIQKSYLDGDSLIISASPDDITQILKLNGFKFAGTSLSIEAYASSTQAPSLKDDTSMSEEAKKTQDRIREILNTRYDVNLKLLNLSGLGHDRGLVQMGMFDAKNRISKLFPVLMVVCDRLFSSAEEKQDAIVSVTLADNDLDTITNVTTLAQTFPDLQNLDISRNRIADLRALEGWRWKFRNLKNLKISANPIEDTMPNYAQEIAKWFPTLQILNDVQIRSPAEAAASAAVETRGNDQISPIPITGPDFRDVNQVGENFIRQFFILYDTDRATLADLFYDEQSVYSLSINVSAPRSELQTSSCPFSSTTFKQSRNLIKMKSPHGQIARLFRGVEAIKSLWADFPPTEHPDLATQTAKYLVDCHPISGLRDPNGTASRGVDGLILMVHGEFEERESPQQPKIQRSFSRTFVLGPGLSTGPLIRVVSELLVLRAWGPLTSPKVGPVESAVAGKSDAELAQEDILRQLVIRTHMTPEYASLCLGETGWDLDQAIVAFNANKSKLPANAFITQQ